MTEPATGFVIGLGIDLVDLDHFKRLYGDDDPDVLARCFTEAELRDVGTDVDRHERRASRLAAKEALYKSLGGGEAIAHTDIETLSEASGAPTIHLHGAALELAEAKGAGSFLVSLTHTGASAGAVVIALSVGPK